MHTFGLSLNIFRALTERHIAIIGSAPAAQASQNGLRGPPAIQHPMHTAPSVSQTAQSAGIAKVGIGHIDQVGVADVVTGVADVVTGVADVVTGVADVVTGVADVVARVVGVEMAVVEFEPELGEVEI